MRAEIALEQVEEKKRTLLLERSRRAAIQAQIDADEAAELERLRRRMDLREQERRQEREDADTRLQSEIREADQRAAAEQRRRNSTLKT